MSTSTELVLGSIQQLTTLPPVREEIVSIRCKNCEALELELAKLQDMLVGYEAENQRLMVENARLLANVDSLQERAQRNIEVDALLRGVT